MLFECYSISVWLNYWLCSSQAKELDKCNTKKHSGTHRKNNLQRNIVPAWDTKLPHTPWGLLEGQMQLNLNTDEHKITELHGAPASNLPYMYVTRARGPHAQLLVWAMLSALHKSRWLFRRVINKSKWGGCVWWVIFGFRVVCYLGMKVELVSLFLCLCKWEEQAQERERDKEWHLE